MKLFLIDDSEKIRQALRKYLSSLKGISAIYEARSVTEASEKIAGIYPNIVIIDFNLPDGTALDVIEKLKYKTSDATIIVFSSSNFNQHRTAALNAGADYYFHKSSEFEKIYTLLEEILENRD